MNFDERYRRVSTEIINKMLEPHGVDMDYVVAHPEIDGLPWYQYYTTTPEQEMALKAWALELLTKKYKYPRKWAEKMYLGLYVNYGLRTQKPE